MKSLADAIGSLLAKVPEPACGWDEWDRRVAEQRAAEAASENSAASRLAKLGIPRRIRLAMESPKATRAARALGSALADGSESIVLAGGVGVGKSVAACRWLGSKSSGMFIRATEFCRISEFDSDALGQVVRTPALVLDDLGQEYGDRRAYFASRIDDLLAARHAEMAQTVITTNLSGADLLAVYGERLASRLAESATWVDLSGEPDLRRQGP